MARLDSRTGTHHDRLPRARGDGPETRLGMSTNGVSAPRTRGWPGYATDASDDAAVCPAHAGMAPFAASGQLSLRGLPRARGDGPLDERFGTTYRTVCPAHAGMNRRQ